MKKIYTFSIAFLYVLFMSQAFGQTEKVQGNNQIMTKASAAIDAPIKKIKASSPKGDTEPTVYWSEDFSNGFDGQDDNGTWTTGNDQGNLWFQTFPFEEPNGYDPTLPLDNPSYGDFIPFYFGDRSIINSETRDNGVMMLDADRYNSTKHDDVEGESTNNPILSSLISPSIDLSEAGPNILLSFTEYVRQCCGPQYAATVDLSTDGGSSWIPYDVFHPYGGPNNDIRENIRINISEALGNVSDLSNVKIRFLWSGNARIYFWMIDDIKISDMPDNDLTTKKTFYNDYYNLNDAFITHLNQGGNAGVTAEEYYKEFEYNTQPNYLVRPFNFGAIVSNFGITTQTGIVLHVDATLPDASVVTDYAVSEPIMLEAGATDTITIVDVMPDPQLIGDYTFDYEVIQNEVDQYAPDNMGNSRSARIVNDNSSDGFSIIENDANSTGGSAYNEDGEDRIWGVPFVFPEAALGGPKYITHIEVVLLYNDGFAETQAGEVIYFNVREGSVIQEGGTNSETLTTTFFDSGNPLSYEDIELEQLITEDEIWNSADGFPMTWLSFELPSPILIDANTVYQAEFRVPPSGAGIVYTPIAKNQERYAATEYDFSADPPRWYYLGSSADDKYNSLPIRFRTNLSLGIDKISQENGIELVQNYPNPFTNTTKIQYRLEETSSVSIEVHDLTGKLVFTKDLGTAAAGAANTYQLKRGSLSPGVYTYSIITPENTLTRKLTVE